MHYRGSCSRTCVGGLCACPRLDHDHSKTARLHVVLQCVRKLPSSAFIAVTNGLSCCHVCFGCCAVVQRDEPTQAEVDALHARVLAELTLLFEQRKHLVPALAHKTLETLL